MIYENQKLIKKYEDLKSRYEKESRDCEKFFNMLVALGIDNPYQIDQDKVEEIGETIYKGEMTIQRLICHEFYHRWKEYTGN